MLHLVYDQSDPESAHAQYDKMLDTLAQSLPGLPRPPRRCSRRRPRVHRVPQRSVTPDLVNNPIERLNREIRRCTDVVGFFPDRTSVIHLGGAVLAEQHDEWIEGRRHLGLDVLARAQATTATPETTTTEEVPALT